jgi:holo-[acyl-carrier protein] synthase
LERERRRNICGYYGGLKREREWTKILGLIQVCGRTKKMEQLQIGVDIIEISRIRRAIQRWQDHFLERIYTVEELKLYRHKIESLAARFAGKEAAMKALSALENDISWQDVEILSDSKGKPVLHLYGRALERLRQLGLNSLEITLSHSRENAIALVIGLRER